MVTVGCDVIVLEFAFAGFASSLQSLPFKIETSVTAVIEGYHLIMLEFVSVRSILIFVDCGSLKWKFLPQASLPLIVAEVEFKGR